MINEIILFFLKRKTFKGQFRLFLWLYNHRWLYNISTIVSPITGNFNIKLDTKNFIDASIYYTGDYEAYLKKIFKRLIKPNNVILDIGANIGFHTLYFAELTGTNGKVIAFEPIPHNFAALENNISLNNFPQIVMINKALGNTNSQMNIHINEQAQNPGAFNLFEDGVKNTIIECTKGDDYLQENNIKKVDFIKIDVEGFELEVLKGLAETIKLFNPIIIFEYDYNYQSKLNNDPTIIFNYLKTLSYNLSIIDGYGNLKCLTINDDLKSSEILAIPFNNIN